MSGNPEDRLELVFANGTYQLTGVAVNGNRVFTNYPLWSNIYRYAVTEVSHSYQETPYPDALMNNWKPGDGGMNKWVCVQSVYADGKNNLWVVDPAAPKMEEVVLNSHKLVKIDIANLRQYATGAE